ncbi:SDR family NAD(P)-dependent oxidoreductase [Novosphingobium taihuense]|uniref:3-oxoacyl-[acyl-carrier protein] reductase n=1 Tax=Novosphingobium taihuense TaxID=260085 RepID=A0A7W7ABY1_9SPHN|nr:SDR family NAD(P)-dependent oxidoreductase [Novosphingobium taihuense]MBB4614031.1 3-oxoacyl-[acyl-carrier protein] reductase [Novosphingobium taihuense]TWH86881.1 3-oxoacyl-[acyl-carrier protein] reductase [Novosphingobium taihuense]
MAADSVLITGGARGLGEALVRAFHAAGWRVAVSDIDGEAAQALAQGLDPSGETALGLALDVRQAAQFEAARDAVLARWGSVEALVNNAVVTRARPVLEIDPDEFSAVVEVNLRGTFIGCQVFGRLFKASGYGRIVNIASLAGQNGGTATGAHYAASKGGIITLTKVFARDLGPAGVAVTAIAPGPLDSPAVHELVPPAQLAALVETIPVRQLGDTAFIARTAVHLAGRDAAFANGAVWDANGGLFMR